MRTPKPSDASPRPVARRAPVDTLAPQIRSVLHPSDLSEDSALAFVHALKIALLRRTKFEILNVAPSATPWHEFPQVRGTLERWGLLAPGARPSDVMLEAGIDVAKIARRHSKPATAILTYLRQHPADLIVLSTARRTGGAQIVRPSIAEAVVRKAQVPALLVQAGARGFVDPKDGSVRLRNVLVPVSHSPRPQPAVDAVARVFATLGVEPERLVLAHAGTDFPDVKLPPRDWEWEKRFIDEPVEEGIARTAEEIDADLVIMTSAGRRGIGDWLKGSTTERVVRLAPCPVFVLPIARTAYRT